MFLLVAVVASVARNIVPKIASAIANLPAAYRILGASTAVPVAGNETLEQQVANVLIASGATLPGGQTPASVPSFVLPSQLTIPGLAGNHVNTPTSQYNSHTVIATVFWVGEPPDADNSYITNTETEWDPNPVSHFGGVDDPNNRTASGMPAGFAPLQNPFYFALPVSEYDANGNLRPQSRSLSPWAGQSVGANQSLLKGRWIRVQKGSKVVYAQWLDTGPYEESDYNYVYGTAAPSNTVGEKAGLDVSPAAAIALGVGGSGSVTWRFADASEAKAVNGPWNSYPYINNTNYW